MSSIQFSTDIHTNEENLKKIFMYCSDVIFRNIQINGEKAIILIYINGLVQTDLLDNAFLKLGFEGTPEGLGDSETFGKALIQQITAVAETTFVTDMQAIVNGVLNANIAIVINGEAHALLAGLKGFKSRAVEEPNIEYSIRGPKESFTESLLINTSLLRRKIRSPKLKLRTLTIGELTRTEVLIAYVEGLAQDVIINEVLARVDRIQTDGILDTNYIQELIEDSPFSPFPLIQNTERPDIVASSLLEGKVAIIEDGTPTVLIMPMTIWSGLQTPDDYYERYIYTSIVRLLRFIMVLISLFLPAIYVAVSTYHSQLIPTNLLFNIINAREGIPFSAVGEALIMEFMFEVLREASNRLPKQVGSAVSIVGALVIGQAAVQAGIVSAPMVIVVATTGIASFTIPRYSMGFAFRLLRFPILILGGIFGLYGVVLGVLALVIHLVSLQSFGVPYLSTGTTGAVYGLKDTLIRAPRWSFKRASLLKPKNQEIRSNTIMIKKTRCFFIVTACMVLTTGCWDRLEVNDAAIVVGSGVDLAKNNEISVTAQFKQPVRSTQGEIGQNYFSANANGKNVTDAMKNMQAEISRRIIRGQRQIVFVGEDLARKGLFDLLDSISRNPESKLRVDVMVVQGGTAEQILKRKYPLEPVSAIAALKEKMAFGMGGNTSLRDFLVSASTVGSSPTLETLQIIPSAAQSQYVELKEEKVGFRLTGSAIFNQQLKLVGFLNLEESRMLNWIRQELKSQTITITKPNMGNFSFVSSHLQSKIRSDINGGRIKFHLTLEGSGAILENSIPIDLNQTKNLSEFEDTLNQETQKNVIKMVKKVQNVYGTDIFGFGESIHKQHPQTWKSLKNDWDPTFAHAEVDVKVNLVVKRIGTTGPSLHLKKGELIK